MIYTPLNTTLTSIICEDWIIIEVGETIPLLCHRHIIVTRTEDFCFIKVCDEIHRRLIPIRVPIFVRQLGPCPLNIIVLRYRVNTIGDSIGDHRPLCRRGNCTCIIYIRLVVQIEALPLVLVDHQVADGLLVPVVRGRHVLVQAEPNAATVLIAPIP